MTTQADNRDEPNTWSAEAARWLLGGPLAAVLAGLMLLQLGLWIPHYLTWPYWADHDVFATAARAWFDGKLPYRDTFCNNFPGSISLFAILGATFGWGRPAVFHAFDAALLVGFLGLLSRWSKASFATRLPGLVAGVIVLGMYLSLDYAHAGQRDWHAPVAVAIALMIVQTASGSWRLLAAGLLCATALSLRPQAVLLIPAVFWAVVYSGKKVAEHSGRAKSSAIAFSVALGFGVVLAFAPLFWFGIFGDFVRSLKLVAYGGGYNRLGPVAILKNWVVQAGEWRWWVVPFASLLFLGRVNHRSCLVPWLMMLAGASFYKPISPIAHSYLDIPSMLVWSVNVGAMVGVVLSRPDVSAEFRLGVALLALGLGVTSLHPTFCAVGPTYRASVAFLRGEKLLDTPPGYRRGSVATTAYYPWSDYRALLAYLRETRQSTPIANMLKGDPAVTAMVDRPSVFPAEAVTWLRMVRREDESRFAGALERSEDGLVIWVPGEVGPDPTFRLDILEEVVRRKFQFDRRFGRIEVWRRKPLTTTSRPRRGLAIPTVVERHMRKAVNLVSHFGWRAWSSVDDSAGPTDSANLDSASSSAVRFMISLA